MVDQTPRYRPYDLDVDIHDKTLTDRRVAPYKFEQSVRTDSHTEDPVPAFLSDYDGVPDPSEYVTPLRKHGRRSVSARILAGILATAAAAILFAMVSSDATRHIIGNATASIAASLPAYAALQPDRAQLTVRNPNDATRLSALANQTSGVRAVTTAAVAPTPEEITTAYQSAIPNGRAAAATPLAAIPTGAPAPVAVAPPAATPEPAAPVAPVAPAAPVAESIARMPRQAGRRLPGNRQGLRHDDDQRPGIERRRGEEIHQRLETDVRAI